MDAHLPRFLDHVHDGGFGIDEEVVDRLFQLARRLHVQRQVTLGVEIDQQHALALLGECGAQVDGGGGLPNPALLHRYGDRSGQERSESNRIRSS